MLDFLLTYGAVSLLPAAVAAARRKAVFALQLAFVGLAISVAAWIWVLLFPDTAGMGIAYVLTPITIFGSLIFAVVGSLFAAFVRR